MRARVPLNVRAMISAAVLLASIVGGTAQEPMPDVAYCPDLKQLTVLAMSGNQFAAIAGKRREGSFRDTTLLLAGWEDCALYGATTYTCDSHALKTSEEAEDQLTRTTDQILRCLAGAWVEIKDRSSPDYAVLHPAGGPPSIPRNSEKNKKKKYLVLSTFFLRRR